MRIISKFQDYYDGVQAYGSDKELVYLRQKKEYEYKVYYEKKIISAQDKVVDLYCSLPNEKFFQDKWNDYSLKFTMVGFCGKWYVYAILAVHDEYRVPISKVVLSTPEDLKECIDKLNFDKINDFFYKEKYVNSWSKQLQGTKRDVNKVFSAADNLTDELFLEYNSPILTFKNSDDWPRYQSYKFIETNSSLKELGFQSIKDPYSAFQDLSMYVGGVLSSTSDKTSKMSDEVMRDKKGFDNWSFKTMPGTKKPRRKKK